MLSHERRRLQFLYRELKLPSFAVFHDLVQVPESIPIDLETISCWFVEMEFIFPATTKGRTNFENDFQ
ncbi:hypothetical protein BBD24_11495 [Lacticaseibacillus paracasei subsp. paracasei]|nr:hypothetical protein BBD24_11495 [Lacticaseibacillus paracasei subsp. paracasei]ERN48488.1 hypothetical protein N422_13545 [Lacticaseibacillus paracasei]